MNRTIALGFAAVLGIAMASDAYGWGAVSGPRGGAAYRGPAGGAAAVGPRGGAAVRAPAPGAVVRPPAVVRPVYVGGVRPWVRAPYFGAVVAGVTLGALIAATTVPPQPSPELCWYWSSPAQNQGYWDYCR